MVTNDISIDTGAASDVSSKLLYIRKGIVFTVSICSCGYISIYTASPALLNVMLFCYHSVSHFDLGEKFMKSPLATSLLRSRTLSVEAKAMIVRG